MKKAVIAICFDDGRRDTAYVIDEILSPRSIPATLYITTGYVDGTCPEDCLPAQCPAMDIPTLKRFGESDLIEFGLHSDRHTNLPQDAETGKEKLTQWLSLRPDTPMGFASPNSQMPESDFRAGILSGTADYLRLSLRIVNKPILRVAARRLARIIHSPALYRFAYCGTIMFDCPDNIIYSLPVMNGVSIQQLKALIDECVRRRGALCIMLHSVGDAPADNWSIGTRLMTELADYLVKLRRGEKVDTVTVRGMLERLKINSG